MGLALYRKYRSKSLDEIVGQTHVTDMLRRAIAKGNISHAYLLTGPKGVGKTSIARILAHEINQLPYTDESTHLDIIEIDAASNNSVEDIRDLRERVMIAPVSAAYKVYIIDEVHMLSKQAFNALLKTLEEPPSHIVFILATTDADKLPATIISRVQRFNFRSISPSDAATHLRTIADAESIAIDDDALELIARHGHGSFRDSIGLLDQLRYTADGTITRQLVEQILGLTDSDTIERIIAAYQSSDLQTIVRIIDQSEHSGTQPTVLAEQLIGAIRSRIVAEPHLMPLLDALLEVNRSSWPHIKLLTALSVGMVAMPPSETNTPRREKPIADHIIHTKDTSTETTPQPQTVVTADHDAPEPPRAKERALQAPSHGAPFDWARFTTAMKEVSSGAYALLQASSHELNDTTLTIYAGRKFAKTKLDAHLTLMAQALSNIGAPDLDIVVVAAVLPPKDRQTADILAIMGGGEEVSL